LKNLLSTDRFFPAKSLIARIISFTNLYFALRGTSIILSGSRFSVTRSSSFSIMYGSLIASPIYTLNVLSPDSENKFLRTSQIAGWSFKISF
jgi:hypothetical protein